MNKQLSEFSITITIYSRLREGINVKFYVRNLCGTTKDENLEYIRKIQQEIVDEIYFLTGYGGRVV
ncbi:hypothetical protein QUF64_15040 [Anaerolineales bacterium HSG6]|nr:hypothetical protein [Anaerolineales bacterium HSG6]